jgi:uncharacterized OB-fold protein
MPILDRLDHAHRAKAIRGDLPFRSVYTAGIAGEHFLRALKDQGKILGTRCTQCDVSYVPGRLYCERCFAHLDDDAWFDAGTHGSVHTFTIMHIDLDETALPAPRIIAFIEIDGTDGGLVHNLDQVDPEEIFIGMPVQAVLKPAPDRTGSITDISHFEPSG